MQNLVEAVQSLRSMEAGPGIELSWLPGGVVVSLDFDELTRLIADGTTISRARATGYSPDQDHYMGKILKSDGSDADPNGEPVDLYCDKGKSSLALDDIRGWLPHLILLGGTPDNTPWPVYQRIENGELRWYVNTIFIPWCDQAAMRGRTPTFRKPPPSGGGPGGLVEPTNISPKELQTRVRELSGGRPCDGCGD